MNERAHVAFGRWMLLLALTLVSLNVALPRIFRLNGGPSIQAAVCIALLITTVGLHAAYVSLVGSKAPVLIASTLALVAMLAWSISQVFIFHERLLFSLSFVAQWGLVTATGFGWRLAGFRMNRAGDPAAGVSASQFSLLRLTALVTVCAAISAVVTQVNWESMRSPGPANLWPEMVFAAVVGGSFALVSFLPIPATLLRRGIAIYLPLAFAIAGGIAVGFSQLVRSDAAAEMAMIFVLPTVIVTAVAFVVRRDGYRLSRSEPGETAVARPSECPLTPSAPPLQ